MKQLKRIIAITLTLILCLGMFPSVVLADNSVVPFTVADANGAQYELSQTSISLDGFQAYYKITVPENYGSLSIRGDGLVFGNCVNGCYGRFDDNPIQANEAFVVGSEHSNSSKVSVKWVQKWTVLVESVHFKSEVLL